MKDKVFIFVIGLLLGAVLTASGFLLYEKNRANDFPMQGGERFEMMEKFDGQTPPEKPDGTMDSKRPEMNQEMKTKTNS